MSAFGSARSLRGDNEPITVGAGTNIQEGAMLHTDLGFPLRIGAGCTIGHHAIVHGCILGDNVLIGMGATVMNGAIIGSNSIVGAGALVTENKVFPEGSLIVGAPARLVRTLDDTGVRGAAPVGGKLYRVVAPLSGWPSADRRAVIVPPRAVRLSAARAWPGSAAASAGAC